MKNCLLILLLLGLTTDIGCIIFKKTEDLVPVNKQKRKLNSTEDKEEGDAGSGSGKDDKKFEFLKSIYDLIISNKGESELVEDEAYAGAEDGSSFTLTMGENKTGCEIIGETVDKNKIKVVFKTPLDTSTLTLSNIDPTKEETIVGKYINPFFSHVSQIISGKEEIEAAIVDFVKNFEMTNYNNAKLNVQTETTPIIVEMANETNTIKELFHIELNEMQIKIKNIYFETNFELSVPTKNFLNSLLTEIMEHVLVNYIGIQRLTSNHLEDGTTEKAIGCSEIPDILNNVNKFNQIEFQVEGETVTFGEHSFNYKCDDINEEIHAIIIHMTSSDGKIEMKLPILKHSLYDLQPAIESFYYDVKEIMYKSTIEQTDDEFSIYEDDNSTNNEQVNNEVDDQVDEKVDDQVDEKVDDQIDVDVEDDNR